MKENKIEEDIKRIEYIFEFQNKMSCQYVLETEDGKAIQRILSDYKRVLKENEELKNQEATQRKINELLVQRYSNSISVQKVKDKIEEIQEEGYWLFTTDRDSDKCVEVLQELIEGEN